jgi:hypothetical protein
MKNLVLALLLSSIGLCGCARHYVLRLTNGYRVDSFGKPRRVESHYYYKDVRGDEHFVPAGRVLEIGPASMMKEERNSTKPGKSSKHRHWYLLWLASGNDAGEKRLDQST